MPRCSMVLLWGWCGECYANRRGRTRCHGHYGFHGVRPKRRVDVAQFARRAAPSAASAAALPPESLGSFEKAHPALWEYLSLCEWEPGQPRETSALLLFCDEGLLKGMLNDRDGVRVCFVAGGSVSAVLKSLEKGLVANTLDWRPDRKAGSKRKH